MNWIEGLETPGHIIEAINHYNTAIEGLRNDSSAVSIARSLFDALNKIQTEWVIHKKEQDRGEVSAFKQMILDSLSENDQDKLLQSEELKEFIFLKPQIMNHRTLRRCKYRPDTEIEQSILKKVTREHQKALNAYEAFLDQQDNKDISRVIAKVTELLYIVRSNIAHGEKTPYGPDFKKIERDKKVCEVVEPLQKLLLNTLLDYPQQKLVVYGTLAPENVNRNFLTNIQGDWLDCIIHGNIDEVHKLFFFNWQPKGPPIKAWLLVSEMLPESWDQIDQFEGSDYKRILIPIIIKRERHQVCIANIYVANKHL